MKPCTCPQDEQDSADYQDSDTGKFEMFFKQTSMCFTDHKPPIFTRKDEACNGTKIENAQETAEKLQLAHNETIQYLTKQHNNTKKHLMETNTGEKEKLTGNWTAYTVVAIFITLVLTVLVTVTVIKMCFP